MNVDGEWVGIAALAIGIVGGYIKLRERLIVVETKLNLFFKDVSLTKADFLHSPHTPELDLLLEKVQSGEKMKQNEVLSLIEMLKQILKSSSETESRKSAAGMLMATVRAQYYLTN